MNALLEKLPIGPLTLGLTLAGLLLLVLLVLWSGWKTRRNTPKQPDSKFFPPDATDLPGVRAHTDGRRDPTFDAAMAPPGGALSPAETAEADGWSPTAVGTASAFSAADGEHPLDLPLRQDLVAAPSASVARQPVLDPLIDVIATIALDVPLSSETVLQAMPPTRRVGSKPFAVEGQPVGANDWAPLQPGARYRALQTGVQMANRTGALNEIEFSEFVVKTQAFADAIGGACEFPEMLHEVARARELDQFASDHDAQLGLHVHAQGSSWSPGYVQQQASRLGFSAGPIPGRMVLGGVDAAQPALLTLSFDTQAALAEDPTQAALREVRLSLDVPQVDRSALPFAKMREVATKLASAMEGVVTDERGQRLPAAAMDQIQTEVERLYDKLDGRDLSAGSPLARRVFS